MEVKDPIYCFEVARRSVGRAALHLGIENMSETALDVLADILLNYLGRVGRTLSHLVETNGRTSAHANLIDALSACEMEAPPVVQQLHLRDPQQDNQLYSTTSTSNANPFLNNSNWLHNSTRDWKGLASFLFGPRWLDNINNGKIDQESDDDRGSSEGGKHGGKHFPSSNEKTNNNTAGWQAPYPDEVPIFPTTTSTSNISNPHPLSSWVGLSLHRGREEADQGGDAIADVAEKDLQTMPDNVFQPKSLASTSSPWGGMTSVNTTTATKKRKHSEDANAANSEASPAPVQPNKKAKTINDGETTGDKKDFESKGSSEQSKLPPNVPSFYPPPPSTISTSAGKRNVREESRKVMDMYTNGKIPLEQQSEDKTLVEGSREVRSSLVQLGSSYWGSGWDASSTVPKLAVPLGRREGGEQESTIVPLGRASGSRVSRILEGSMDAAAMQ